MADAKPQELDPALIMRVAQGLVRGLQAEEGWGAWRYTAELAIRSLGIPAATLNALARGEASVRPNLVLRTLDEWHEDIGPVLWWFFPLCEPPYVGSPLDQDWPGYHTHWTPIECPNPPAPTGASHDPR